jgi:hypothetical protein
MTLELLNVINTATATGGTKSPARFHCRKVQNSMIKTNLKQLLRVFMLAAALLCSGVHSMAVADATTEDTGTADQEIKKKLNELLAQPDSSLNRMKTFEKADEVQVPSLRPLSATVGRDIDLTVARATAFTGRFVALSVKVENKSDKTLVVDGDRASLSSDDTKVASIACLTQANVDAIGKPPTTAKAKITTDFKSTVEAALTLGAIPTAQTIIVEHGPILKRYEWDESRREHEEARFGKRLLYPGDKSDGMIYFKDGISFDQKSLVIPVKSFYDGADQAALIQMIPPAGYTSRNYHK